MSQQSWMRGFDRPILMVPGPTEVPCRVLRGMAQPPMIQYEPPFDEEILEPAGLDLRQAFQTTGEVVVMPESGRTGLEAAAVSLVEPGDRAVVVVAGVFGPHYVLPTLSALGMALRDLGYKADTGDALAAAQSVFDAGAP